MAHILAIDDDPDLCRLLRSALERDGHQGLGLYFARTVAAEHGGRLLIGNREDRSGGCVTLELPAASPR